MAKQPDNRYITRMDYAKTHGWWVRVGATTPTPMSKLFSDGKCGGKRKALDAARRFRNAAEKKVFRGVPRGSARWPAFHARDKRSKTGTVGVSYFRYQRSRTSKKDPARKYWSEGYCAKWTDARGKPRNASFTIRKYGRREAFRLAVEKRKAMIRQRLAAQRR
jgi:hypothetical protein